MGIWKRIRVFAVVCAVVGVLIACPTGFGNPDGAADEASSEQAPFEPGPHSLIGFWDFNGSGSNALTGGESWVVDNILFADSLMHADGIYDYSGEADAESAAVLIDPIDMTQFSVAALVNAQPEPNTYMPVLACGRLHRWLILSVEPTGEFGLRLNNHRISYRTSQSVEAGVDQEVLVAVNTVAGTISFTCDGTITDTFDLPADFAWNYTAGDNPQGNEKLLIQDYANGTAFKGRFDWILWANEALSPADVVELVNSYKQ